MKSCNRLALAAVVLWVSSAWLPPGRVQAQDTLTVADLGKIGGSWATALDVNARGVVVGVGHVEDQEGDARHAFMWKRGRMTDLGTFGGRNSEALAVDKAGRVVGWAQDDTGRERAFVWQDGEMVDLNDLTGRKGYKWELQRATDINRKGHIVGYGRLTVDGETDTRAFVLNLARPKRIVPLVPIEDGRSSKAYAINDAGQVVGISDNRGVLWDDGEIIDLGHLGQGGTIPLAINNGGAVVGYSDTRGRRPHAFLWTRESGMIDLGTLGGPESRAYAISDDDTIVGSSLGTDAYPRAFIWRDGIMTRISDLLPYELEGLLNWAYGINDAGQIVGRGSIRIRESDNLGPDAFIANELCANVTNVELECFRGDALQTTIRTRLPEGSIISVEHPVEGHRLGTIDARGRATFEWLKQSDMQKVCVDGCPDACATTECLPPPEQYLLVDPGTLPGGEGAVAFALNMADQIVGSADTPYGHSRAVLWQEDWVFDLGTLGGTESWAGDINDAGQVAGAAATVDDVYHAFLWQDGLMRDLGTLGGDGSGARGLNAHGQVVGRADVENGESHAFVWRDGEMFDLGSLGGTQSQAYDINDAQQITGTSYDGNGSMRGFFWSDGGPMRDIGTLGGSEAWPYAINEDGAVVGNSKTRGNGRTHAFLWTEDDGMVDLGTLGGLVSAAYDINNAGQVVGQASVDKYEGRAFIWEDGAMTDLNDLVPAGCAWDYLRTAFGINARAEIVGSARAGDDGYFAFLMTHAYCGDIRELTVKCNSRNTLTARLTTTYRPGTILTLSNGDGESQCVIIDALGRGKAQWHDQSGPRDICVEQCRDLCESVDCP